jgi:hypothetical protein
VPLHWNLKRKSIEVCAHVKILMEWKDKIPLEFGELNPTIQRAFVGKTTLWIGSL